MTQEEYKLLCGELRHINQHILERLHYLDDPRMPEVDDIQPASTFVLVSQPFRIVVGSREHRNAIATFTRKPENFIAPTALIEVAYRPVSRYRHVFKGLDNTTTHDIPVIAFPSNRLQRHGMRIRHATCIEYVQAP